MNYFIVDAEVAGDNVKSSADWNVRPNVVYKLHYEFDAWPDDALLASFPCWVVTIPAKMEIQSAGLTGARFDRVEVSKSEQFEYFRPDRKLPEFAWLKVEGEAGRDDFGISRNRLVVSERALNVLKGLGIERAKVSSFDK
jgi:hypothetical protein